MPTTQHVQDTIKRHLLGSKASSAWPELGMRCEQVIEFGVRPWQRAKCLERRARLRFAEGDEHKGVASRDHAVEELDSLRPIAPSALSVATYRGREIVGFVRWRHRSS